MEYSPASKLQVNINDFSSLLWILKSARQSGSVSIELQSVDEAQIEQPWRAYLSLLDGDVTACFLYRKADGQRILADKSAMLWLHNLGRRKLLWSLESSYVSRQQRLSGPHTHASLLPNPSPTSNGQTGLHATPHPLSDPHSAPPLQARSRTTPVPLPVPRQLPSPQSSSHSVTGPVSEPSLLVDPWEQVESRTTTNPSSVPPMPSNPHTSPHMLIDPLSDPGFRINYRTGPHTTTDSLSEQHPTGNQQTPPQRPVALQPDSFASVNRLAPSVLTQVPYRIAPIDQEMDAWSRRHRQVFLLADGRKSVAQIVDILGLPSATVEQIVADLLSWGAVLCI